MVVVEVGGRRVEWLVAWCCQSDVGLVNSDGGQVRLMDREKRDGGRVGSV